MELKCRVYVVSVEHISAFGAPRRRFKRRTYFLICSYVCEHEYVARAVFAIEGFLLTLYSSYPWKSGLLVAAALVVAH